MAIDTDGNLIRAIPDTCKNYVPTSVATIVKSQKLGTIYECSNYKANDVSFENSTTACLFCKNITNSQETYQRN